MKFNYIITLSLLNIPVIHLSCILINSLTCIHILISSPLLTHICFYLLYTLLSSIQYFLFKCLKLSPIMECDPYRPILLIVCTVQFSGTSAILINLIHLFSKKNSESITAAIWANMLLCVLHGTRHTVHTATLEAIYNSCISTSKKGSS